MNGRWLGNLLVPLNSTMIVVAVPQVARDLKVDVAETSWIVTRRRVQRRGLPEPRHLHGARV